MRKLYQHKTARYISYLLLISICGYLVVFRCISRDNDVIFSVNEDHITREEFVAQMNLEKAAVFDFFQKKYQTVYHKGFWTTSYAGEIPLQKLKAQALTALTAIYVKKQFAVELGVLHSSNYAEWLKNFAMENERRAAAIASGQVIYGPSHFDQRAYAGYYLSNLENAMKEAISHQSHEVSDEALLEDRYQSQLREREQAAHIKINKRAIAQLGFEKQ